MPLRRSVLVALTDTHHGFFQGVARYAQEHHWHLVADMIYTAKIPVGWRGDGIVSFIGYRDDLAEFILSSGLPAVEISMVRNDLNLPRVEGDCEMIGRLAADHFLARGFRHFAWAPFLDDALNAERYRGFANVVNGSTPANNRVALGAAVTYGGVLNIVPSGTFTNGQTFTLFSGAGAANASNFGSIAGSPGAGKAFGFTNGVLAVVSAGPSGPAVLTNHVGDGVLSLSWPAGQGWRLQYQTDALTVQSLTKKRTVYAMNEIQNMIDGGPVTVLLFRYQTHLHKKLTLEMLTDHGILNGAPQSVTRLTDGQFESIKVDGEIDRSLVLD